MGMTFDLYYFYAASRIAEPGEPIVVSVPSGNFGDMMGAVFARQMGLPEEQMQGIISIVCPQMIYPYLRAIVSDICTRAGFPPIMLTEVNFQAMFEAQQQQAAAGTNGNGSGNGSRIITSA